MCEEVIKKMLFSVSANGNPMCQLWIGEDADVTKTSDSIYIALAHQVAYLFFLGVGSKIKIQKNNKGYYNVEVPDYFTNLFEGYKTNPNETIKLVGNMLNMAFKNTFNSIEFIKNGETVKISQDEADSKCAEYLAGYTDLYQNAVNFLSNSKVKALKAVGKVLNSEDSKASEIKEANQIAMSYTYLLAKDVISKNNYIVEPREEKKESVKETEDEVTEKPKATKSKKSAKKAEDDEIPF